MARPDKEYEKLTGKGRPPFPASLVGGASQLYLAKDHLLKVESSYWTERYRRYYFRDIRLLQVTQTQAAFVTTVVILVLTLFFGMIAYFLSDTPQIVFATVAAIFLVFAIIKFLSGPSCRVRITTPLGADDLFALSRLRVATKAMNRLVPLIRNAQEAADPAVLAGRLGFEAPSPLSSASIPTIPVLPSTSAQPEAAAGKKWVATWFAILLCVHAGLSVFQAMNPSVWLFGTAVSVLMLAFAVSVFLLIRPVAGASRRIVTAFIVCLGIYMMLLYVTMMRVIIADPVNMSRQNAAYGAMIQEAGKPGTLNLIINLFAATSSGVIGILVVGHLFAHRSDRVSVVQENQ